MVNFAFFRSRSFLGANLVGFFVSFAMLAQFFFLALYMQNILHYSPLQAGIRFLPSTLLLVVMGPLAGRLTDRVGARPLLTTGLVVVSASIFLQSGLTVHTSYLRLLPGFMLMGIGIGLVMSPMSTAAMNSVDRTKAGAASGVLSMSRMVGGTFGVAVMGALIAALGRSEINQHLPQLPAATRAAIANSLGAGGAGASRPRGLAAGDLHRPARLRLCPRHRLGDRRCGHALWRRPRLHPGREEAQARPGPGGERRDRGCDARTDGRVARAARTRPPRYDPPPDKRKQRKG